VTTDDGYEKITFDLDEPHIGVYIPNMVWKDMYDFSKDSVLLVLASEPYDDSEYIREYDDFLEEVRG
ncbi:MAG: WxcM-like domain-containing protein, partial [Proteocatella sp.]